MLVCWHIYIHVKKMNIQNSIRVDKLFSFPLILMIIFCSLDKNVVFWNNRMYNCFMLLEINYF